jgi:plasmid maintenance system antidote protein VapI
MNPLARYLSKRKKTPGEFARLTGLDRTTVWRIVEGQRGAGIYMAREIERVTLGAVKVSDWPLHRKRAA